MNTPQPAKGAPQRVVLTGRYVRLEPLESAHAADLLAEVVEERFAYLPTPAHRSLHSIIDWIEQAVRETDPLYFSVINLDTGRAEGRQALMRIVPEHGVIEVGGIYWGPSMARTRRATEALYLHARYVFETLGYRRFEWKCNDLNLPSKRAAERFGFTFEGVFRQHMIVKGANRDTAWFAMLDGDWPRLKQEYERWLDPANFSADGRQITALSCRQAVSATI